MLIVDGHLDLAWNALQWNRDLRQAVYTMRTQEVRAEGSGRGQNTVAFPEMRQGRVALSFATLLARSTGRTAPHIDYASPAQAFAVARGQLAYYEALQAAGEARIITDADALQAHVSEWEAWEIATDTHAKLANIDAKPTDSGAKPAQHPPLGFVISMEGADPIQHPAQIELWHQLGLRLLGLTHYGEGRYAGGTSTESGLTPIGREILPYIERLGIVLDLTHCSDQAFWQVLESYSGVVLASHQNCRALVQHQRQFSDEQLKAIIARNGVIGASFDIWMLKPNWTAGNIANHDITLETVVNHIDHVCQLAGNADHAALGTDLDGGFGREQSPHDLDTIADLQKFPALLAKRGYSHADIEKIMYKNWLRLLFSAWKQ